MTAPLVLRTVAALRAQVASWRREGQTVALVPTMGALHAGHIALAERALALADRCVVSIFVNPRQFAPSEDLDKYPRTLEADLARLAQGHVHAAYVPGAEEIYPAGFSTAVSVAGPAKGLEADFRPHFFDGVATVVGKLLIQAAPDVALFGEKDYQQLCVVRRLVRDLDIPARIVGVPTIRDAEGLALSSRNAYLDADQIAIARRLNKELRAAAEQLAAGADEATCLTRARQGLIQAGFDKVDYVEARASESLAPWRKGRPGRILAAAWLRTTRLIDNLEIAA